MEELPLAPPMPPYPPVAVVVGVHPGVVAAAHWPTSAYEEDDDAAIGLVIWRPRVALMASFSSRNDAASRSVSAMAPCKRSTSASSCLVYSALRWRCRICARLTWTRLAAFFSASESLRPSDADAESPPSGPGVFLLAI